jgi:hypothetical protein
MISQKDRTSFERPSTWLGRPSRMDGWMAEGDGYTHSSSPHLGRSEWPSGQPYNEGLDKCRLPEVRCDENRVIGRDRGPSTVYYHRSDWKLRQISTRAYRASIRRELTRQALWGCPGAPASIITQDTIPHLPLEDYDKIDEFGALTPRRAIRQTLLAATKTISPKTHLHRLPLAQS